MVSAGLSRFGRHLSDALRALGLVAHVEFIDGAHGDELDRRYCLCPCACIYNFHIHWSELQDSVFFIGENASCGRLSVGQQDVLRAACAYHSNSLSSLSEHVSYNQHKELSRPSGKRIPSSERLP